MRPILIDESTRIRKDRLLADFSRIWVRSDLRSQRYTHSFAMVFSAFFWFIVAQLMLGVTCCFSEFFGITIVGTFVVSAVFTLQIESFIEVWINVLLAFKVLRP